MTIDRIGLLQTTVEAKLGLRLEVAAAATLLSRHGDALLDRVADPDLLRTLVSELTVGETYFYRHAEQLHAYREVALPDRLAHATKVRVLSAGCSTGEEPYTLAMLAADHGDRVEVTGIELNPASIARAARGRYTRWSLRALPFDLEQRWFTKVGAEYQLVDELRDAVRFQHANLADPGALPVQRYDIVFCRNVLMYFTPEAGRGVIERLVRALVPGGYLVLGHAELLREPMRGLALRESHGTFYYQCLGENLPGELDATWFSAIAAASQRIRAMADAPRACAEPAFDLAAAVGQVRAALAREDFRSALATLEAMPVAVAGDPELLLLRAVALTENGDPERASAACDALLAVPAYAASAHYLQAVRREASGDLAGALRHAERATQLAPDFAICHMRAGLLARRTGDRARARAALAHAIEAFPEETPQRVALHAGGLGREQLLRLCRAELAALDAEGAR